MSYHPIVKEPKLALKGYNSNTTNEQDIANELQGCLPLRIRLNYDSEEAEANVEFKMLESGELYIAYLSIHLTHAQLRKLSLFTGIFASLIRISNCYPTTIITI